MQHSLGFASQAEDFDLITGDDQMARIDGYSVCSLEFLVALQFDIEMQERERLHSPGLQRRNVKEVCATPRHNLLCCRHDGRGFLVNKKYLPGSVLCSGRLATLWAADKYEAVTIESLSLLMLMQPAPGQTPYYHFKAFCSQP